MERPAKPDNDHERECPIVTTRVESVVAEYSSGRYVRPWGQIKLVAMAARDLQDTRGMF